MQLHETNKELARPRGRRPRQAREPPQDREPGLGRAGQRPPAHGLVERGRDARPRGDAQPRVRRRPPGEVGRDAPDPQGHLGQPHAVGRRPAQAGRPGAEPRRRGDAEVRATSRRRWPARSGPRAAGKPPRRSRARRRTTRSIPRIVDMESSQNSPLDKPLENKPAPRRPAHSRRSRLPVTTVMGKPKDTPPQAREPRRSRRWTRPCRSSSDLLAEFEKIADELNRVLANLEGSTLVKRLKAASRLQYKIGGRISDQLGDTFGVGGQQVGRRAVEGPGRDGRAGRQGQPGRLEHHGRHAVLLRAPRSSSGSRRSSTRCGSRTSSAACGSSATTSRRRTASRSPSASSGPTRSTAGPKTWSTRPATASARPSRTSSLPPAIVLEVLQILEAEVNLREETRVAEQARPAVKAEEHKTAGPQALQQPEGHPGRTEKVTQQIRELPDGESQFPKEIALLDQGRRGHGRGGRDPRPPRDGQPGHRRRDRGHRAAAPVQADQPQGRRRRRLQPRRRRHGQHASTRRWP